MTVHSFRFQNVILTKKTHKRLYKLLFYTLNHSTSQSIIVHHIAAHYITLFIFPGNAEMTDVFKCKKAGTQCCAPKSKVQEVVGGRPLNDTAPLPLPQPATNYQHYTTAMVAHTHTTPMGTVDGYLIFYFFFLLKTITILRIYPAARGTLQTYIKQTK